MTTNSFPTSPVQQEIPAEVQLKLQKWKETLASPTDILLPTDFPRPLPLRVIEASKKISLPDSLCNAVLRYALNFTASAGDDDNGLEATPFSIVMAAFVVLVQRYSAEDDISICTCTVDNNPLILRLRLSEDETFDSLVQKILLKDEESLSNEVPFELLLQELQAGGDHGKSLVSCLTRLRVFDIASSNTSSLGNFAGSSDVALVVSHSTERKSADIASKRRKILPINLNVVYNSVLFNEERINVMFEQLIKVLQFYCGGKGNQSIKNVSLVCSSLGNTIDPLENICAWGTEWPGAITDIFMKNAASFPDRVCLVESIQKTDDKSYDRTFNYKTVDLRSSLLAHYMIQEGIKPGDVVVVYAHRCAELVICIMAILKAGAVFSVIDPQYPVPRQLVYLSVARPKGLLRLKKACPIDKEVENYVNSGKDFELKFNASEVELLEDGMLKVKSSSQPKVDSVFNSETRDVKFQFPVLGPDSIGTLSFTSGSTGIPKGVLGRHFSLTNFYPWMKERFGLGEKDRFTMLSGIAHDPIQRDIFTPLFFGAELRIPTADDIAQPGRLAEWMATQGCTVTHLTPAMGQLLSTNASTSIPSLRNAFFVGDILTKRDVVRLQSLAPNVLIINMYGTTETQRAVSYYAVENKSTGIAHEKDVLPAGVGMKGVQLLVVNKERKMCGIGEIGEIYVRSFGLAEGYLNKEEDTRAKFVSNFFVSEDGKLQDNASIDSKDKGPRDRLYKTGDLGRYRPDGVVECCGRADDQVKIRGFRIELGEIDMHLSQHESVRENVTLVRRDAYEEKTLVSYFVPNKQSIRKRFEKEDVDPALIISDIRNFLKQKLAAYSIPSSKIFDSILNLLVFVPLARMPLTPNGKVDKNALPFPDTVIQNMAESASSQIEQMTAMENKLSAIWSQILFPKPGGGSVRRVLKEENFFDIGGHSILATRLIFQIRQQLKMDDTTLPLNLLFKFPTIKSLAGEIEKRTSFNILENIELSSKDKGSKEGLDVGKTEIDLSSELHLDESITPRPDQRMVFDLPGRSRPNGEFEPQTIFLTGATGFLGSFILRELLLSFPSSVVYCLVRGENEEKAWNRLCQSMEGHLIWKGDYVKKSDIESMKARTKVVPGDLAKPFFGIGDEKEFLEFSSKIDCVVHNGALVHWVYPYDKLKAANVSGTIEAMKMCLAGNVIKPLVFVSSTSVLDTPYYTEQKTTAVLESDDLEGSRRGLSSGYGQSKWVAEKLLMLVRKRRVQGKALPVSIVRPGYILGDSKSGVGNADDFLWRLIKGCLQLGQVPVILNAINACSVDFVAKSVVQVVRKGEESAKRTVFHVWNDQNVRFSDFFASLIAFGYGKLNEEDKNNEYPGLSKLEFRPYLEWRDNLMELTLTGKDNALYPLLHYVLDDLPTSTKSPALDMRNLLWALEGSDVINGRLVGNEGDSEEKVARTLMYKYLSYMCTVGFLPWPPGKSQQTHGTMKEAKLLTRTGQ